MAESFDDPNRESVGLPPIWSGSEEGAPEGDAPPEGEADKGHKGHKGHKDAAPDPGPAPKRDDDPGAT